MEEDNLKIFPPLYLVGIKIYCWKCDSKMSVVALVAPKIDNFEDEVCVLSDIVKLPNTVLSYIQKRVPTFKFKYSKTVGSKYFANTCPKCGVISGDFFLHSEPGAPFFPMNEEEASLLYRTEIPISEPFIVKSGYHIGTGELILNYSKPIA